MFVILAYFVVLQGMDLENVLGKLKYKTCSELNLLVLMLQQHLNRLNLTMCRSRVKV
jgi:hypothetical protein